jgi:hypothetical protein
MRPPAPPRRARGPGHGAGVGLVRRTPGTAGPRTVRPRGAPGGRAVLQQRGARRGVAQRGGGRRWRWAALAALLLLLTLWLWPSAPEVALAPSPPPPQAAAVKPAVKPASRKPRPPPPPAPAAPDSQRALLRRAVEARAPDLKACALPAGAPAKLGARIRVSQKGTTRAVTFSTPQPLSRAASECLRERILGWQFADVGLRTDTEILVSFALGQGG